MKETVFTAAVFFCVATLVMWVFASLRAVEKARVEEMANRFFGKPRFELLELKELLIKGHYDLNQYEVAERIEAINIALNAKERT